MAKRKPYKIRYLIHCNGKGRMIDMLSTDHSDKYGEVQREFAATAGGEWLDCEMEKLHADQVVHGVSYTWGLAGPDGAWYMLIATPDTTAIQIRKAKAQLRSDRDVVKMSLLRIKAWI